MKLNELMKTAKKFGSFGISDESGNTVIVGTHQVYGECRAGNVVESMIKRNDSR